MSVKTHFPNTNSFMNNLSSGGSDSSEPLSKKIQRKFLTLTGSLTQLIRLHPYRFATFVCCMLPVLMFLHPRLYLPEFVWKESCFTSKEDIDAVNYMIDEFHKFYKDTKLHYWIDYGTLIGSMRHGGMIPWDHDADIVYLMPGKWIIHYSKKEFKKKTGIDLNGLRMLYKGFQVDLYRYKNTNIPGKYTRENYFPGLENDLYHDQIDPRWLCGFGDALVYCPHHPVNFTDFRYHEWRRSVPYRTACYYDPDFYRHVGESNKPVRILKPMGDRWINASAEEYP